MIEYVLDLTMSLSHHGFTKVLIINGHGSNAPVLDLVARQTILRSNGKTACASMFYMQSQEYQDAVHELFPEMENSGATPTKSRRRSTWESGPIWCNSKKHQMTPSPIR